MRVILAKRRRIHLPIAGVFVSLLLVFTGLTALLATPSTAFAASEYYDDEGNMFYYDRYGDGIAIYGGTFPNADLVIPETIDGYRVSIIWQSAFMKLDNLVTVTIPSGMREIGFNAFRECPNLTTVICYGSFNIQKRAFSHDPKLTTFIFYGDMSHFNYNATDTTSAHSFQGSMNINFVTENPCDKLKDMVTKLNAMGAAEGSAYKLTYSVMGEETAPEDDGEVTPNPDDDDSGTGTDPDSDGQESGDASGSETPADPDTPTGEGSEDDSNQPQPSDDPDDSSGDPSNPSGEQGSDSGESSDTGGQSGTQPGDGGDNADNGGGAANSGDGSDQQSGAREDEEQPDASAEEADQSSEENKNAPAGNGGTTPKTTADDAVNPDPAEQHATDDGSEESDEQEDAASWGTDATEEEAVISTPGDTANEGSDTEDDADEENADTSDATSPDTKSDEKQPEPEDLEVYDGQNSAAASLVGKYKWDKYYVLSLFDEGMPQTTEAVNASAVTEYASNPYEYNPLEKVTELVIIVVVLITFFGSLLLRAASFKYSTSAKAKDSERIRDALV